MQYNINAVSPRLEELKLYIYQNKIDILLLNEIKLDQNNSNFFLNIEGFTTYDKPRTSHGGGVAILIKKEIDHFQIHDFDHLNLEILSIKISTKKGDLLILTYYNPKEISNSFFSHLSSINTPFILGGDLNACSNIFGCTYNNKSGAILAQALTDYNFVLLNNKTPTRLNNILDLFICSPDISSGVGDLTVDDTCGLDSDHHPVIINYYTDIKLTEELAHPSLNFHRADWERFKNLLSGCQVDFGSGCDTQLLNNQITSLILNAAKESIPYTTKKQFKYSLPQNIINLIKLKRKNRRKYQQSRHCQIINETFNDEYKRLTTQIRKEIKLHRNSKWEEFLKSLGPNPTSSKPFWQRINKFRTKGQSKIPTLLLNQTQITTDFGKSTVFCDSLAQTFCLDQTAAFDTLNEEEVNRFLLQKNTNTSNIFPEFTLKEIKCALTKLKKNTAKGFDGIHNQFLKNLPTPFIQIILQFFNKCMKDKQMPLNWKTARITMIPKKDQNKTNPNNYRPISVTSCLGKLYERLVAQRLYSFLKSRNLLSVCQSGFRAHRCTLENIMFFTQKTT